jgi:transposase, IS5 family
MNPMKQLSLGETGFLPKAGKQTRKAVFLGEKGLSMKRGMVVDATLIAAPSSTKNQDKQRDPEMTQTKKGNQWLFGMKAHIGVDAESGLIHTVECNTAKVAASQ